MSIDRKHWKEQFAKFPSWLCPTCQSGTLALDKTSERVSETGPSDAAHQHDAWEPEWIEERFSAHMVCQNPSCGEIVAVMGRTRHEEESDWELQERNWSRYYEPHFAFPMPPIFKIPDECAATVGSELVHAFSHFWNDPGACANRLRNSVEAMLTERGVRRTTISRKGKRERLSLHARIDLFKAKEPEAAKYLLAVKWLGNAGSHSGLDDLDRGDLLDGFELVQHVTEHLYVNRKKRLDRLANKMNSRKGRPVKRRKKVSWI